MRVSDTLCKLIYGTGAFPAYMIGWHVAHRLLWMDKARGAVNRELKSLFVGFARRANRELLTTIREFRNRNPEAQR